MTEKAKKLGNEPAFPQTGFYVDGSAYPIQTAGMNIKDTVGLTKREYFAGLAMNGLIICKQVMSSINNYAVSDEFDEKMISDISVRHADALLEKLSKENEQ